ncbi:hypothetical protein DFZ10_02420 [Escherichia coli]|nr:hypothetical protein [Escherichia coli]EFD0790228.1 hypothetical protein [Escherichia coli]EFN9671735.1 hypothetical protein [Escherichia coli]TGI09685.1 hypothetical protein E5S46_03770 [Escherichia coli]TXP87840.1 hypothetical protein FV300_08225 [Escherichia coli]
MIFKREYTSHPGRIIRSRRIQQPCYDAECLFILQIYQFYKSLAFIMINNHYHLRNLFRYI